MHVAEPMITGMTDVFQSPHGADKAQQKRALKQYYSALDGYSAEALDATLRRLIIRHTRGKWPLPAEIIKIASEVSGEEAVKETNEVAIETALATPQGQYALKNGSGMAFLAACKQLGWVVGQSLTDQIVKQVRSRCDGLDDYWLPFHQRREVELRSV